MELFANCRDVFRFDATREPERESACFFAEERLGDGFAGAAGDAFDFRVEENAGFAVFAEVRDVIKIFCGTDTGGAVIRNVCIEIASHFVLAMTDLRFSLA